MGTKKHVDVNSHTALLIIDMQRAFLEENGGIRVRDGKSIIPNILGLMKFIRKKGGKVIWTRISTDLMPPLYRSMYPHHFASHRLILARNGEDHNIVDEMDKYRRPDDLVIDKYTYDAFLFTGLELYLRRHHITRLLFTGVSTNVCVESSLRHAFQLGFETILVSDCTRSFSRDLQLLSEKVVKLAFGYVVDTTALKEDRS
jgi:nicotinamidase-related amidase